MMDNRIVDEIISLEHLRLQKAFVLDGSILCLECYSKTSKKLFLIFDTSVKNPSLHVQFERPMGTKTIHPLALLLRKYGVGKSLRLYKVDEETIKGEFTCDEKPYSLFLSTFGNFFAALFANDALVATLGKTTRPQFKQSTEALPKKLSTLEHNLLRAKTYGEQRQREFSHDWLSSQINVLKKSIAKKRALQKNVENDYEKCQKSLARTKDAELLKSNLHLIQRGMAEIEVIDYEQDPPALKKILLDQKLSPKDFLAKMYQNIKKAKRGLLVIEPRLESINKEIKDTEEQLIKATTKNPLADFPEQPSVKQTQKPKKKLTERLPFRTYLSSDNLKILVGRSSQDSDEMTLHFAHGNDWWLHADLYAGAHVLVKSNLSTLPIDTLHEAGLLAMYYSKAKDHPSAVIQYTRAKFIKKPKGLAKGKVLVSQEKRFEVARDPEKLAWLLNQQQQI